MEGLPLKRGVRVGVISDDLIYLRDDPGDSSSHIASQYAAISAARVPLPPRRPQSDRNGSYRPPHEAANATVQKSRQLRRICRWSDRPIAALGPRRLQSAGSSLAVEPTAPSPVCIRSQGAQAGSFSLFKCQSPPFEELLLREFLRTNDRREALRLS